MPAIEIKQLRLSLNALTKDELIEVLTCRIVALEMVCEGKGVTSDIYTNAAYHQMQQAANYKAPPVVTNRHA